MVANRIKTWEGVRLAVYSLLESGVKDGFVDGFVGFSMAMPWVLWEQQLAVFMVPMLG